MIRFDQLGLKVFLVGLLTLVASPRIQSADKPNIVIIVSDDQGYADAGFRGSDIRTPNIDRLAEDGVVLDRFYSAPICSPTRMGLMTGRWPIRFGRMNAVIPPWRDAGLPEAEYTLAELLKDAGYRHRAAMGKWHMGHLRAKWLPLNQGFNHFYGHYNGAIDYFTHRREGALDWHRNGELSPEKGYSTDLIGQEAVRFIRNVPREEPYFLYLPFNAPHAPFQAKENDLRRYPGRKGDRKIYAAMVDAMDQQIGKIMEAIKKRGDEENTFVLFFSDNGGLPHTTEEGRRVASDGAFRGHKHLTFEGGIRVLAIARWPSGGIEGGRHSKQKMGYIDLLPTIKEIVDPQRTMPNPLDGIDILGALRENGRLPDRPWYSYYRQSPDSTERLAIHEKGWKLVRAGPSILKTSYREQGEVFLFNIEEDSYEKNNLADQHPGKVTQMLEKLRRFRRLEPGGGLPPFPVGRDQFIPPPDWKIR